MKLLRFLSNTQYVFPSTSSTIPPYCMNVLCVGRMVIALNFYIRSSEDFMTRYLDFSTTAEPNYFINIWPHQKLSNIQPREDKDYFYDVITFNENFYYRQHKKQEILDLILPVNFESWEIDNFLKLFFSSRCIEHGSILLHASGIIQGDKAILFAGPSGVGKSTIAKLSGYNIIHDDIIALEIMVDKRFRLYTIPFKTGYKRIEYKCSTVEFYRIYQDLDTFVEKVSVPEGLTLLLFGLWGFDYFQRDSTLGYNKKTLTYCYQLTTLLNPRKLYFSLGTAFITLL